MIVGALVHVAFALLNHSLSEADVTGGLTAIIGGVGLIQARDANVTSEQQGLNNREP